MNYHNMCDPCPPMPLTDNKDLTLLGGDVLFPPQDSPFGRFAVLRDPQGATFNAIRPLG